MIRLVFSAIFLLILCSSLPSYSGMYSWTDEKGVRHFTDTPPPEHLTKNASTLVKEIIKANKFSVPVFKLVEADDPNIVGTYIPTSSTHEDLPRYILKKKKSTDTKKVPKLYAERRKGDWRWELSTGYSLYYSDIVPEGTPPSRVPSWNRKYKVAQLAFEQHKIVTDRKIFSHEYHYNITPSSTSAKPWQKFSYNITEHPEMNAIGEYTPVSWSSPRPRYRSKAGMCLALFEKGNDIQWLQGKCELQSYSSKKLPADTTADKVKEWIKNAGYYLVSIQIEKIGQ